MFQSLFPSNRTFFISQPSWTYIYLCYLFICCPSSVVSIIKLLNCMVNQHLCLFILLSGNATATWQCCHLSGKAAIYLAMLLPIRQCCHLSGNAATHLAMLLPGSELMWIHWTKNPGQIVSKRTIKNRL